MVDHFISNPNYVPKSDKIRRVSTFETVGRQILKYLLYSLPVLLFMLPFVALIFRSFFTWGEIVSYQEGLGLIPKEWTFDNYREIFSNPSVRDGFFRGLGNTMIVVVCNVIGVPLTAYMSAYAFTKIKFKFRKIIFTVALGTIMIPGILIMVPVYQIFSTLGWTNSLLPLTIPCFFGGGIINIFMIMQFIRSIPNEIDEAAIIDGANLPTRMFRITLPLIKPIIIYLMVISFFAAWNDFAGPLMYIKNTEAYTLNLIIYYDYMIQKTPATTRPNIQMAIGVVMMIPMGVIFVLFQKQLIAGLTFGAVKE